MTLADRIFGGSPISPRLRYAATWLSGIFFTALAVGIWFVPDTLVEGQVGRWGTSLLSAALAAFCWWGNRWIRAEMRREADTRGSEVGDRG